MPVIEVTYYQAVCDCCGYNHTADGDEHTAWSDPSTPLEGMVDYGDGLNVRGLLACADCATRYRQTLAPCEAERLGDGDVFAEHAAAGWIRRTASTTEEG